MILQFFPSSILTRLSSSSLFSFPCFPSLASLVGISFQDTPQPSHGTAVGTVAFHRVCVFGQVRLTLNHLALNLQVMTYH